MARLIIRPAAGADLRDAIRWYDEESPGLGDRFLDDLRGTQARIREMPLQFPDVGGARRALLHTFPFAIYFVLLDPDRGGARDHSPATKSLGLAPTDSFERDALGNLTRPKSQCVDGGCPKASDGLRSLARAVAYQERRA